MSLPLVLRVQSVAEPTVKSPRSAPLTIVTVTATVSLSGSVTVSVLKTLRVALSLTACLAASPAIVGLSFTAVISIVLTERNAVRGAVVDHEGHRTLCGGGSVAGVEVRHRSQGILPLRRSWPTHWKRVSVSTPPTLLPTAMFPIVDRSFVKASTLLS